MKQGKSLVELAQEIERQKAAARDMVADTRNLSMTEAGALKVGEVGPALIVNDYAHRQISQRVGIPAPYYDKMKAEAPELLAQNVNTWFQKSPERRMLRTLDNRVRAFLSDRYQRIDNHHVANVVLPILLATPGIEVVSCEVTERRMYIKAVSHAIRAEVRGSKQVGDIVESGAIISNSEIGAGSLSIFPFIHRLVCLNGMVRNQDGLRKYHVGRRNDIVDGEFTVLSDNTKRLEDQATLSRVGDVLKAAMDEKNFAQAVARMEAATGDRIGGNPVEAVEVLGESFGFVEAERTDILRHLIEGADLSRYGLIQAITRTAHDVPSYDRATELETFGGALLDMTPANWGRIALAA